MCFQYTSVVTQYLCVKYDLAQTVQKIKSKILKLIRLCYKNFGALLLEEGGLCVNETMNTHHHCQHR